MGRAGAVLLATMACACAGAPCAAAQTYEANPGSLSAHKAPNWWKDGKLGIFIHWGVYSVPAWAPTGLQYLGYAEWYWAFQQVPGTPTWQHHLQTYGPNVVYDDFIPQFRAERFDPDAWIKLFEEAGAKYFVLTAKHHDGFNLWPTRTSDRNSARMGPHRDLVGDLFAAAHRADDRVKPGLYYSVPEWFSPAPKPADHQGVGPLPLFGGEAIRRNAYTQLPVDYTGYKPVADYAKDVMIPSVEELIHEYHPNVLWCDIGGNSTYYQSDRWIADFYNAAQRTNPEGVVVDDRCGEAGKTHKDFTTAEYSTDGSYPTGDWEATRGMGYSFGYNQAETDAEYLTPLEIIKTLVDSVAHGGNLLLDIGPKADGTIPEVMTTRLHALGDWLKVNGRAIYGSRQWTVPGEDALRYTKGRDGALYVTAFGWPGATLTIPDAGQVAADDVVTLLGSDEQPLTWRQDGASVVVTMPDADAAKATTSKHAFVVRIGRPAPPAISGVRASGRRLTFTVDQPAKVTIRTAVARRGRYVALKGALVRSVARGTTRVTLPPRGPGTYRLTLRAVRDGRSSAAVSTTLRVRGG